MVRAKFLLLQLKIQTIQKCLIFPLKSSLRFPLKAASEVALKVQYKSESWRREFHGVSPLEGTSGSFVNGKLHWVLDKAGLTTNQ